MNIVSIIIIFSITALIGLTLLTFVVKNKHRPLWLVALHGIMALTGLGTLTFYIANLSEDMQSSPQVSSIFFGLAAMGGLTIFTFDKIIKKPFPKWLPFVHGAAALTGYVLLWLYFISI